MKKEKKRFAEFFSGAGLMRLGLEAAGWKCVFANDNDPKKAAVYTSNFGPAHFIQGDVHGITPDEIPDCALATASFPCTDLSLAGARKGLSGRHSGAFFGFVEVISGMGSRKPRIVMLENVTGFLTSGGGKDIRTALRALCSLGYGVDMFVMDAKWFTPQSRPRLFIIGALVKSGGGISVFNKRDERLKNPAIERIVETARGVAWSFRDIPSPPEKSSLTISDIADKSDDARWWDAVKTAELIEKIKGRALDEVERRISSRKKTYATVFLRVRKGEVCAEPRFDGIAGCIRTPRGGSSRQIMLKLGGGSAMARYVTAAECAKLQGVGAGYKMPKSESAGLFAFGDAVCVPLVRWIGENILNNLL